METTNTTPTTSNYERFIVEPTEITDSFCLGGTAFYDDVPTSAVWMSYAETLQLTDFGDEPDYDEEPYQMCECEIDWNCPLHQGQYTGLERQNDAWASQETDPYDRY